MTCFHATVQSYGGLEITPDSVKERSVLTRSLDDDIIFCACAQELIPVRNDLFGEVGYGMVGAADGNFSWLALVC